MVEVIWIVFNHIVIAVAIPIVLVFLLLSYGVAKRIRKDGLWLGRQGNHKLRWVKCKDCEQCGVVMMDGTPIPLKYRTFGRDGEGGFTNGPLGNVKTCETCLGIGGGWYDGENFRPPVKDL
jgi:hypothetical protein